MKKVALGLVMAFILLIPLPLCRGDEDDETIQSITVANNIISITDSTVEEEIYFTSNYGEYNANLTIWAKARTSSASSRGYRPFVGRSWLLSVCSNRSLLESNLYLRFCCNPSTSLSGKLMIDNCRGCK